MDELERLINMYGRLKTKLGIFLELKEDITILVKEEEQAKQNLLKYIEDNYISKH